MMYFYVNQNNRISQAFFPSILTYWVNNPVCPHGNRQWPKNDGQLQYQTSVFQFWETVVEKEKLENPLSQITCLVIEEYPPLQIVNFVSIFFKDTEHSNSTLRQNPILSTSSYKNLAVSILGCVIVTCKGQGVVEQNLKVFFYRDC